VADHKAPSWRTARSAVTRGDGRTARQQRWRRKDSPPRRTGRSCVRSVGGSIPDNVYPVARSSWYPNNLGIKDYATYDITYHDVLALEDR
jgi:hypothetical protein